MRSTRITLTPHPSAARGEVYGRPSLNQQRLLCQSELRKYGLRTSKAPQNLMRPLLLTGKITESKIIEVLVALASRHDALRFQFLPNPEKNAIRRWWGIRRWVRTGIMEPDLFVFRVCSDVAPQVEYREVPENHLAECLSSIECELADIDAVLSCQVTPLGSGLSEICLSVPHLICDETGMEILSKEFAVALMGDDKTDPFPRRRQFSAFLKTQEDSLASPSGIASCEYWRNEWDMYGTARPDLESLSALPLDKDASAPAVYTLTLTKEETASVIGACRSMSSTPFMMSVATFALSLNHDAKGESLAFWVNLSNRRSLEDAHCVGWLAHTHLLGLRMDKEAGLREFVNHVRRKVTKAMDHQGLPLAHLWWTDGSVRAGQAPAILFDFQRAAPIEGKFESSGALNIRSSTLHSKHLFTKADLAIQACARFDGEVLAVSITSSGEPVKEGSRVWLLRQWHSNLKEIAEQWGNHLSMGGNHSYDRRNEEINHESRTHF